MSGRISGYAHVTCFKASKDTSAADSLGDSFWCFIIYFLRKLFLNSILHLSCPRNSNVLLIWTLVFSFSLFLPWTEQLCFFQSLTLVFSSCACFQLHFLIPSKYTVFFLMMEVKYSTEPPDPSSTFPFLPKNQINNFFASWEALG